LDEPVTLDGSGSTALAGIIVSWEWDLDDDGQYDDALGETVPHTWSSAGTYPIGLKVTSSDSLVLTDEGSTIVEIEECGVEPPEADLWAVQYRWGAPVPGFSFAGWPVFEGWMNVRIENRGTGDAFNVTAEIMSWPSNTTVPDPDVTVGDIPSGGSSWSADTFTTTVNMASPVDQCEEVFWRIEYDDATGAHHVVENVPEFPPGEGPAPCP
jgi:PKD repeat protein